jgi:hypothetical protein
MDRHRTIEPQSIKFVQFLRDRHGISPAASDLARTVVAKFGGFARSGAERPALLDHGLTWQWRGIDAVGRNEMDGKSQQAPAKFTLSKDVATPLIMARPENMIQRKFLPSAPPAGGGFSTIEPHAAQRSPVLSAALPLFASGRFSASASPSRESTPPAPTASAARVVLLRPALTSIEKLRAAGTLPESDGPSSSASISRPAESREQSPTLFRFNRNATPIRKVADQAGLLGQPRFVSPVLAGIPVSEMSANHPNLVRAARGSVATRFAISSETSSWRLGEASRSLGDFPLPTASLVQAWAPEPFHAEFFSRDIRINPLGRAGSLAATLNSEAAAAFQAPSFDLSLQLPKTPVASDSAVSAIESSPRRSVTEGEEVTARSTNSEMRPAAGPPVLTVPEVADRVYRLLERRLVIERERRGVFRT